ncbi:rCG41403 [Rattus norvegicus]|uniref:RCG41403 n=1 Tax=Rattus norvegicus TaxID=10116 RepID=A6IHV4_RAT|nr:rCG41403 [Rattus norvegicus]
MTQRQRHHHSPSHTGTWSTLHCLCSSAIGEWPFQVTPIAWEVSVSSRQPVWWSKGLLCCSACL